jgi:hypothetical protein
MEYSGVVFLPYLDAEATVVTHTWVSSGPGR